MKKKIVSVCLTAMLVGGLSMTSMQEARAAEGKSDRRFRVDA